MASRFLCGFDDYDTAGLPYEWALLYGSTQTIVSGLSGSCLRMKPGVTTTTSDGIYKTILPATTATAFIGFRFLCTANASSFMLVGNAGYTHLKFGLNTDGTMYVGRSASAGMSWTGSVTGLASGTHVFTVNTPWYLEVELTIHDSTGVVKTYVNGNPTADISFTGDTKNTSDYVTWVSFLAGLSYGNDAYLYLDDVYVNDTTGSKNTGLEGDAVVKSHRPNANGNSSQWDRSTGSDQYATIDESPQSTTDYNSTSTLNEVDTVNIESLADAGATIKAVQVNLLVKKSTSGTGGVVPVMRVDSVDYPHATTQYLSTDWSYIWQTYDQQADATDWNETDFNATEVGYKKTA